MRLFGQHTTRNRLLIRFEVLCCQSGCCCSMYPNRSRLRRLSLPVARQSTVASKCEAETASVIVLSCVACQVLWPVSYRFMATHVKLVT